MKLEEILCQNDILKVPGFSAADPFNSGNITMTGNGYLGFRGVFPDWSADKYAACTVTDTFDLADGKWKELCNVPVGLYFKPLYAESEQGRYLNHSLNYRYGLTSGKAQWSLKNGGKIDIAWERFASYSDLHLIPQKISIRASEDCSLKIKAGIDGRIWSLNGNHFSLSSFAAEGDNLVFKGETTERKVPVVVGHRLVCNEIEIDRVIKKEGIFTEATLPLKKDRKIDLYMYMSVFSGNDVDRPGDSVVNSIEKAVASGYEGLFGEHCSIWDTMWETAYVRIQGDELSDRLLRYNMYHNFISTPAHTDTQPIGARGLSCQAYQGAAFWDQEIYNLPMFLYTRPDVARNILIYRYKTMAGAKRKAARLGYKGAFYAWISGDTGDELCPDYFFRDVITGRKIRNHFNDWQIHISPDISYTIIKYYEATDDFEFIRNYGAEMLLEIAYFLYSRVHYNFSRDRFEVLKVLGPDEYHENADNNAFTNVQVKYALEKTLEIIGQLKKDDLPRVRKLQETTKVDDEILGKMEEIARKMYIPRPDEETGLIEQFDGYFQLEDISPAQLRERLIDEEEYWGWPNGIAYETQVMKQADVVQMFVLHDFPVDIMRKNYLYYEPRTQHRSSLSPGVHAIIGAQIGLKDQSIDYFRRSCSVDIANTHPPTSGGTFIGGIHTAACGIAWQIVVKGFAGFKSRADTISFEPNLPDNWTSLEFTIQYRKTPLTIIMKDKTVRISCAIDPDSPVTVQCHGEEKTLKSKGEIYFG